MTAAPLCVPVGTIVTPGDRLIKNTRGWSLGLGTYLRQGAIYSSTVGTVSVDSSSEQQQILTVVSTTNHQPGVLQVDSIVVAKVVRLSLHQVTCNIMATQDGPLSYPHEGHIRREDLYEANSTTNTKTDNSNDNNSIRNACQPGDILVARILALGDTRRYILSIAEPQLGVIHVGERSKKDSRKWAIISTNGDQCE